MPTPTRNRRDHYIPQGYMRGFIDPNRGGEPRPLWHFDIPSQTWSERSTREIGYRVGFYDYAAAQIDAPPADDAFAELERKFPLVRDELISAEFAGWRRHLDFLLRFAQMMRARSLLFLERTAADAAGLRAFKIKEVSLDRRSVRLHSMEPEPLPDSWKRNYIIAQMRTEIEKGSAWLKDLNWCLRYCETATSPFIISEQPLVVQGHRATLLEMVRDPGTLFFFPLCWQACLIGSRQFFHRDTDRFGNADVHTLQRAYRETADLFLISPRKLPFPCNRYVGSMGRKGFKGKETVGFVPFELTG